jgi:hypothetical protein
MKKSLIIIAALVAGIAHATQVGIASGNPSGTNYAMTQDIVKTCSTPTSPIKNVSSGGSIENLFRVHSDSSVQYGITQADAAAYQQIVDPAMMSKVLMVFPFFSTEFHIITKDGSNINNLSDLSGRNVIEGAESSGNWVTAQMIQRLTGIKWHAVHGDLNQQQGFDAVKAGKADAQIVVAGRPIDMLKGATGIKLVNVSHPKLDAYKLYTSTMIFPDKDYPFLKSPVKTYKVDNLLVTYAFKNQYQKEIGELVGCITRNVEKLQTTGHPKWRDVDPLAVERIDWPVHPAALTAIKRENKKK